MKQISFVKMQGCGNDYIYIDRKSNVVNDLSSLATLLSNRHFGVGGDGVVFISESCDCDAVMEMYNADGSRGRTCGNALRCIAEYLRKYRGVTKKFVRIATDDGIKTVRKDGVLYCVEMGQPCFEPSIIPIASDQIIVGKRIFVGGKYVVATCLSMGNPHCVIEANNLRFSDCGAISRDDFFPEGVNVELAQVLGDDEVQMQVFERGTGETLSCGSGSCAVVVALTYLGKLRKNATVKVNQKGGTLFVRLTKKGVTLSGDAQVIFEGKISVKDTL